MPALLRTRCPPGVTWFINITYTAYTPANTADNCSIYRTKWRRLASTKGQLVETLRWPREEKKLYRRLDTRSGMLLAHRGATTGPLNHRRLHSLEQGGSTLSIEMRGRWNVFPGRPHTRHDFFSSCRPFQGKISNDIVGPPLTFWDFQHAEDLGEIFAKELYKIAMKGIKSQNIYLLKDEIMHTNLFRNAIRDSYYRWPNAIIPYDISASYDKRERATIALAMKSFHEKTCIRFVPRTIEKDYIHLLKHDGCSSSVGRVGGGQVVSLGIGCVFGGIAMHELMHAAGFWHEHSRYDRDDFVTIRWTNIESDKTYNFNKYNWTTIQNLGYPYDLGSIMHFGPYAFALDRRRPTIITHSGKKIGQRDGLSKVDIGKLNRLYECGPNYSTIPDEPYESVTTEASPEDLNCVDDNIHYKEWDQ
ncbi:unnamed protein product, partial [Meganyctiphanes norvegica]